MFLDCRDVGHDRRPAVQHHPTDRQISGLSGQCQHQPRAQPATDLPVRDHLQHEPGQENGIRRGGQSRVGFIRKETKETLDPKYAFYESIPQL